jgi:hypothetical protein
MDKILKILAFVGCLAAGVVLIVLAFTTQTYALLAFAVVALFGGITGFIYGTKGEPTGSIDIEKRGGKVGGKFLGLPDWVLIADGVLLVIAVIIFVVAR